MIIYALICLAFLTITVFSFARIHSNPLKENRKKYFIFILYAAFSCYTLYFGFDILTVLFLAPLFYVVLDDMFNTSFNILFPIAVFLMLLLSDFHLHALVFSLSAFILFLLFSLLSKERILGMGDVFFIMPLAYLSNLEQLYMTVILACFIGFFYRIGIFIYEKWKNTTILEVPFSPFLFYGFCLAFSPLFS